MYAYTLDATEDMAERKRAADELEPPSETTNLLDKVREVVKVGGYSARPRAEETSLCHRVAKSPSRILTQR